MFCGDNRLSAIRPRTVHVMCHLAGLGTTWDRAPLVSPALYRTKTIPIRPPAPNVPEQILAEDRSGRTIGHRTFLCGPRVVIGFLPGGPFWNFSKTRRPPSRCACADFLARIPLGEHRRVVRAPRPCTANCAKRRLCLSLVTPTDHGRSGAESALVEPADLWATFSQWWKNRPAPLFARAASCSRVVQARRFPRARSIVHRPAAAKNGPSARPHGICVRCKPKASCTPSPTTAGKVNNVSKPLPGSRGMSA